MRNFLINFRFQTTRTSDIKLIIKRLPALDWYQRSIVKKKEKDMGDIIKWFVFINLIAVLVKCEQHLQKQSEILDQILSNRYDARIRPPASNLSSGPVVNFINTFVRRLSLDEDEATLTAQLTFRQKWNDQRLKYENIDGKIKCITLNDVSKLWTPDVFFANEIKSYFHQMTVPNVLLRIYPDGNVLYSMRVSLRLSCPVAPRYPMNEQVCSIIIVSYGYTTDDLIFKWQEGEPIQIVKNLQLPNFSLRRYDIANCASKTNTGEYSCLRVDFTFHRENRGYAVIVYLPSAVFVIMAWIAFWMDLNAPVMRLAFTVIPFVCMVVLSVALFNFLPYFYFLTTISVWMGTCFAFVLAAFILVGFTNNVRLRERDKIVDDVTEMEMKTLEQQNDFGNRGSRTNDDVAWYRALTSNSYPRSKLADVIARIVFPVLFSVFCLIYWV